MKGGDMEPTYERHSGAPSTVRSESQPPTRRRFLQGVAAAGIGIGASSLLAACGGAASQNTGVPKDSGGPPDMSAAKDEGKVVVWYADIEEPMTTYLNHFSEATGIDAEGVRVDSTRQIRRLEDAKRVSRLDADVIMTTEIGVTHRLQTGGFLKQYVSEEMDAYPTEFKSNEVGWWTAFFQAVSVIGYDPRHVTADDAPKTYEDLLDPKWKNVLALQDSAAGSQYLWWYVLKDQMPSDYFDKLKLQNPTAYPSSNDIIQALRSGSMMMAGKLSEFQLPGAEAAGQPLGAVYPDEGVIAGPHGISLLEGSPHPNAAKVFVDYTLSIEGQKAYTSISGARSARPDVTTEGLKDFTDQKLLTVDPKDFDDFTSEERAAEFQEVWRRVVG